MPPKASKVGQKEARLSQRTVKVEHLDQWVRSGELKRFFMLNCGVVEKVYVGRAPTGPNWAYVTRRAAPALCFFWLQICHISNLLMLAKNGIEKSNSNFMFQI